VPLLNAVVEQVAEPPLPLVTLTDADAASVVRTQTTVAVPIVSPTE
jgi:hypothetical protein